MPHHMLKIPRTHQLEIATGTGRAGQQCHLARQPHRLPELHRDLDIRRRQVLTQRRDVRALFHKPWAMAVGKPNSLALTALR